MLNNPFVIAGKIPPEYFCDRTEESHRLIKMLLNQNNVVLISPRRMGKSGLIHHCFNFDQLKGLYDTIYIDILQTTCLKEFVYLFGKAVYDSLVPKTTKWIKKFFQTLRSIQGKISFDPVTGNPSFNIMLGDILNPDNTLDEIFKFIENHDKRVIIAIDEFQQIAKYPEKNIEAMLRSRIQLSQNVNFIYSGSERHLMQEMFLNYNRPFYMSASILELKVIPKTIYAEFVKKQFHDYDKQIEESTIEKVYDLFSGVTYYLQKTFNFAFQETNIKSKCDVSVATLVIKNILEENSNLYREILSNLGERQKEFLYALALEKDCEKITSAYFVKKYSLWSASSVQAAAKVLLEKEIITKSGSTYSVSDKLFSLWIRQLYGETIDLEEGH